MATARRRSEAYSATIVVRLAIIVPMPSPVMNRAAVSCARSAVKALATMPRLVTAKLSRMAGRLP